MILTIYFIKIFNFAKYLISSYFQLNFLLGTLLFRGIKSLVNCLIQLILNLGLGVQILIEDFGLFLSDISGIVSETGDLILHVINWSSRFANKIAFGIKNFIQSIVLNTEEGVNDIVFGYTELQRHLILVGDSILFVGFCVWELVNILLGLLCLNETPYIFIIVLAKYIDSIIFSIPYRALGGLAILTAVIVVTYKTNPGILKKLQNYLVRLFEHYKCHLISLIMHSGLLFLVFVDRALMTIKDVYLRIKYLLGMMAQEVIIRSPTKASLRIQLEREKAENLCVICFEKKRNTMLLNCRHLCMCIHCANIIITQSGDCPICRRNISEVITVYT